MRWLRKIHRKKYERRNQTRIVRIKTKLLDPACGGGRRRRRRRRYKGRRRNLNVLVGDITLLTIHQADLAVAKRRPHHGEQCVLGQLLVRPTTLLWTVMIERRFLRSDGIVLA